MEQLTILHIMAQRMPLNGEYTIQKPYNNEPAAYNTNSLYKNGIVTSSRVQYEEGFDIKFLQNRLGLSGTAFQYIDGPQIFDEQVSSASGYNDEYLNAFKTKTVGLEGTITGTPIKDLSGFGWDVLVNISTYKQTFDELAPGETVYNKFFRQGDRTDKFYGTAFVRNPAGQIINGTNGEPLVNPVPQYLGHLNADYNWSIFNKFHYKNLGFSFQFDGSVGGVTTDYVHNKTTRGGSNALTAEGALGAARYQDWLNFGKAGYNGSYVGKGVVISNNVAPNYDSKTGAVLNYSALQYSPNTQTAFVQEYASEYYNVNEANLMSKTYAKLREVTIDYNFPKKWLERTL